MWNSVESTVVGRDCSSPGVLVMAAKLLQAFLGIWVLLADNLISVLLSDYRNTLRSTSEKKPNLG